MSRSLEIMACTNCDEQVTRAQQDRRGWCPDCRYWEEDRLRNEAEERQTKMGAHKNITYDKFPQQGSYKGAMVKVHFHYDTSRYYYGTIIRDDMEDPGVTIILLTNGTAVLGTECQYSIVATAENHVQQA